MLHWEAVLNILAYLRAVPEAWISYYSPSPDSGFLPNTIYVYVDSDHAGDPDTRRSTSGWIIFLNGGPVAWQVKAQDSASGGGSSESEYKSMYLAVTNAIWMRALLLALGYPQNKPTVIFEDNQAAIEFAHNPINMSLMKHIEVKHHVIRDYLASGDIDIVKIDTKSNLADMFTKALQSAIFWPLIVCIMFIPEQYHRYKKRKQD